MRTLTSIWNGKTRPVHKNGHDHSQEDEFEDEYEEIDKLKEQNKKLNVEIKLKEATIYERDKEIERLREQLFKNSIFMQDIVLKLIESKPRPLTAAEIYASRNSSALSGPAKKLP